MVHNKLKILDEGIEKNVAECKMLPDYFWGFYEICKKYDNDLKTIEKLKEQWRDYEPLKERKKRGQDGVVRTYPAEDLRPRILNEIMEIEKLTDDVHPTVEQYHKAWFVEKWTKPEKCKKCPEGIALFMGKTPFVPCMMFNISPNWKGKPINNIMIKQMKHTLDTYLASCNRYSKWKYVLECGGNGDFLHAHCVAEINTDVEKSVWTHIKKGNHNQEIRKIWDKKGFPGYLKGKYSIQSTILRTETLRDDKLEYLIEELKPEGHKNAKKLNHLYNVGF